MSQPVRVRCAVCNRQVERLEWRDDPLTRDRVVRAFCHGQVDEMRLNFETVANLAPHQLQQIGQSEGVAFERQQIGETKLIEAQP